MKKQILNNLLILALLAPLAAIPVATSGCKSTGQVIASSSSTVDAAMKAWAVYVVDGKSNKSQEDLVKKLKLEYENAESIAVQAYKEYSITGDKTALQRAKTVLEVSRKQLIDLIYLLTNQKGTN